MRNRLAALATLCKRFAAVLRHCDVPSFLGIGRVYAEVAPLERRLDMHIDLLRRDEFREVECVSDVMKCVCAGRPRTALMRACRIQAQFEHLAETYFAGFTHDLGERQLGAGTALDGDLDMFAAALGLAKTTVASLVGDEGTHRDVGCANEQQGLMRTQTSCLTRAARTSKRTSSARYKACYCARRR
jgi:dynactin 1